jgi:hypothetical protein
MRLKQTFNEKIVSINAFLGHFSLETAQLQPPLESSVPPPHDNLSDSLPQFAHKSDVVINLGR